MDPSTGKNIPMIHSCSWYINIRRTILPNASAIAPLGYDHMQKNCLAKSAAISLFCAGKSATANSQQLYQICLHIFLRRYRAKKEKTHAIPASRHSHGNASPVPWSSLHGRPPMRLPLQQSHGMWHHHWRPAVQRSQGDWTRIAMGMPGEGSVALSADLLIYLQRTMKLLCPICSNSTVCEHTLKNSVWEFINLNWQRAITTAVDPMHASFTA